MKNTKVIVIGGGFAGINVAKRIKNKQIDLLLLDKKNHHLFQPLLYQVASAALSPADIAFPLREILKHHKNATVLMGEVTHIDKDQKKVFFSNAEFSYDYLVIATGASHSYFGRDDWASFAPGLKTLPDALNIREQILLSFEKAERCKDPKEAEKYLNFVVIGGGPTGVEMAGAIAEIAHSTLFKNFRNIQPEKANIFLVEAAPRILPPYPASLSAKAQKDLEAMGVKVLVNTKVTEVSKEGIRTEQGFIQAENIIWAAGNQASPLLKTLNVPLDRQGRVIVEKDLSVPHYPEIFVLGDACYLQNEKGIPLPAVATTAIQQGAYIGKILNRLVPKEKRKPFKYFDKGMLATIGRAKAVASIKGLNFSGFFAWAIWAFVHIFYLIGFRNRYSVLLEWYFHYLSSIRGARLIHRSIDN
jgi:NADH dehydrogenase